MNKILLFYRIFVEEQNNSILSHIILFSLGYFINLTKIYELNLAPFYYTKELYDFFIFIFFLSTNLLG
jgi:hypothetical protein